MHRWTLVLAIVLAAPVAAAQAAEDEAPWRLDDPAGDLTDQLVRVVPIPDSPVAKHADVTALTIGEAPGQLVVGIQVAQLTSVESVAVCCLSYTYYDMDFSLSGATAPYRLSVYTGNEPIANANTLYTIANLRAELCILNTQFGFCDHYQPAEASVDDDADTITVTVSHDALLGKMPSPFFSAQDRPSGLPDSLPKGTELRDAILTTRFCPNVLCYVQPSDRVPDIGAGPPYVMREQVGHKALEVSLPAGPYVAVDRGDNQSIPFTVTNGAAAKRILSLSFNLTGSEQYADKVRLEGPAQVTVPGGETRTFRLVAHVDPDVPRDPDLRLNVLATNAADATESASAAADLIVSPGLGPGRNTLFVKSYAPTNTLGCDELPAGTTCSTSGFLAFAADDGMGYDGTLRPCCGGSSGTQTFQRFQINSVDRLPGPVMFDRERPLEASFVLSLPQETNVRVQATLSYRTNETTELLFDESTTVAVGTQPTPVSLAGPVRFNPDAEPFLPAGTSFHLLLQLAYDGGGTATYALDPKLQTEGTTLGLPLVEVPAHLRLDAPVGPLQMSAVSSADDLVNPGESRLYRVSILNQADDLARFVLAAQAPSNWSVDVLPGSAFELPSGDTVTLGVLVRAPTDVGEGDVALVNLTATLDGAEAPTASLPLRTIVTLFDVPDDGGIFNASADDAAKLVVQEGGDTPAPTFAYLAATLAAWAVVLRRRKP